MALTSREIYWSAILADFRRSGLTHVEFCRLRLISLHSFRKWLYHLRPEWEFPRQHHPGRQRHLHRRVQSAWDYPNDVVLDASVSSPAVPEPASWLMLGLGLTAVGTCVVRKSRSQVRGK